MSKTPAQSHRQKRPWFPCGQQGQALRSQRVSWCRCSSHPGTPASRGSSRGPTSFNSTLSMSNCFFGFTLCHMSNTDGDDGDEVCIPMSTSKPGSNLDIHNTGQRNSLGQVFHHQEFCLERERAKKLVISFHYIININNLQFLNKMFNEIPQASCFLVWFHFKRIGLHPCQYHIHNKPLIPKCLPWFCNLHNIIHQHCNLGAILLDLPADAKELGDKLAKESDARVWKIEPIIVISNGKEVMEIDNDECGPYLRK